MKNDTSLLSEAYITSVPNHKSQVFFEYRDVPKLSSFNSLSDISDIDSRGRQELSQVVIKIMIVFVMIMMMTR